VSAEWWSGVYEPAVVGLSLGVIALMWFAAIFLSASDIGSMRERLRSAIAASVVLIFLLLVVDLLTIAGFREALSRLNSANEVPNATAKDALNFVESMLGTFKWVVITVVGFYFGTTAAESVGQNIQNSAESKAEAASAQARAEEARANADVEIARAQAASGRIVESR
jgi:hypothetical protein